MFFVSFSRGSLVSKGFLWATVFFPGVSPEVVPVSSSTIHYANFRRLASDLEISWNRI